MEKFENNLDDKLDIEILKLLKEWNVKPNSQGKFIFSVGRGKILHIDNGEVSVYSDEVKKPFKELTKEEQYGVYDWVGDNLYSIAGLMMEEVDEVNLDTFDLTKYDAEPRPILGLNVESGEKDIVLGRVGIVGMRMEDGNILNRMIFMSADNTWTNLIMWTKGNEEVAKKDLQEVIKVLQNELKRI